MTRLVLAMLSTALVLAFVRLVRGPTLPDRVVALDLLSALIVGFISVLAIETGQRILLEVAIVLALIAFLGTVAFARYLERRARAE
jgi:multicomponent Na+:H+ antiporter subunit F